MNLERPRALALVLSLLLSSVSVHAFEPRPRVALVTSLDNLAEAQKLPWYLGWARGAYLQYLEKTEADFRMAFKDSGYELEVIHYADQNSLYHVLHSPEYRAVYWVSHEAPVSDGAGVSSGGTFDADGFEFTQVLNQIHPNLKVLALIGCKSYPLVLRLNDARLARDERSGLKIYGFEEKVDGRRGLRGSVLATRPVLEMALHEAPSPACQQTSIGYQVRVERHCEIAGPSVRIILGGQVAGVLGRCEAGETQVEHLFAESKSPEGQLTRSDLKLTLTSGSNAYRRVDPRELGKLSISRYGQGAQGSDWTLFQLGGGEAIGVTSQVFRFSGDLPATNEARAFHKIRCQ
jgi:hypothetical protein